MTPGARIEAAIGLLEAINAGRAPADDIVAEYFRRHRFAGVKDRAAISKHIYGVLRQRASIDWWVSRNGMVPDARKRLLAQLSLFEEWPIGSIVRACDGDVFRPMPLDQAEQALITALSGAKPHPNEMPQDARGNYPTWLGPYLEKALGRDVPREMAALEAEAPMDLRVNTLVNERTTALAALEDAGIMPVRTPHSPLGLRVFERFPLSTLSVFKSGGIEVQDEGSQVAALLADARPGMRVVDFCAGAGGKTLALAASMKNKGHLVACDVSAKRLERATQRLRRATASIVQRVPLENQRDKWVKKHVMGFDRVFVDAPCTGTGTWRRNPDAKWRLKENDVSELAALQADILDSAQRLVKPGGRLIYATCSILKEEDEDQVENFLAAHDQFTLVPITDVWAETMDTPCPVRGTTLRLSPARHGTDGFFVAVMQRKMIEKKPDKKKNDANDGAPDEAPVDEE